MPAEAIGLIASLVVLVIALAMAAGGRSREEVADERHCPHYMIPGRSPVQYVREFHLTYGAAIRTEPIARPPERMMRFNLLQEELDEYAHAVDTNDVVEVADALADIVYVAYGAALTHGIDLDAVLAEVHYSNMSKLGPDGKPIRREDGKILKGPNFSPPDIARVLGLKEGER